MDTETNWHRITAALLRENERLQAQLDLITQKYELLQQAASVIPGIETTGEEDTESDDEDYDPSETTTTLYWTDGEYPTDDAIESGSEQEVPEIDAAALPGVSTEDAISALETAHDQTADQHDAETEEGSGAEDYVPSETQTAQYWTDKEYITDDAWETDSAEKSPSRLATPERVETDQLDVYATPSTLGSVGGSPECSTLARHLSLDTPSRFVPRAMGRRVFPQGLSR